jgi:hypothetical protein
MRQMSHAVKKKRSFCARDMPGFLAFRSSIGGARLGFVDMGQRTVNNYFTI